MRKGLIIITILLLLYWFVFRPRSAVRVAMLSRREQELEAIRNRQSDPDNDALIDGDEVFALLRRNGGSHAIPD